MKPLLIAERYTHGARLSGYTRETFDKMSGFLEGLCLKEPKKLPGNRIIMELKKKYYGVFEDCSEVYIHRNSLPDLIAYLENRNIPKEYIQVIDVPVPKAVPALYELHEKYVLRDYQEIIKEDILRPGYHSARVDLQTGKGKCLKHGTQVRIPGGWKPIEALKLGDEVIGQDGKPTKVIGVYPQGKVPMYEVTFRDGRTTTVCGEHLWKVYYVNTTPNKRWRVVDTKEMLRLINMPNPRVYIPLCEPEDTPEVDLPIPPYTLGALLGDGCFSNNTITLSKYDKDLFENVANEFPENLVFSEVDDLTKRIVRRDNKLDHDYIDALRKLGLMGLTSESKFIPDVYLNSSIEQRWKLLQGLMDTDGSVNSIKTGGATAYCSVSYRLATAVRDLVRSLGGQAKITSRFCTYSYKGDKKTGREAFEVNIRMKTPSKLFNIARKKARTNDDNQYASGLKLQVMSIKGVGMDEGTCISVDNEDKLFVVNDYIVTHNTLTSLASLVDKGVRAVVMVPPKYFGIWIEALQNTYKGYAESTEKWMTVSGSAELQKLINRGVENDLEGIDVIVISNVTYRSYIDNYEKYGSKITELGFNCPPPRFHEAVGAGMQINDEIQEDPGLVFRIDIYSNVDLQVYLSATPYTGNAYVTKMIDKMLPAETMVRLPNLDVYINCMCLRYCEPSIKPKDYLTPFKNTYNHARYETQMMLNKKRMVSYLKMVGNIAQGVFVNDRLPGQKLLMLCATVAFIDEVVKHLQERFPDLVINGHYSGSPYERLLKNDITISTIKSSGTGVDIPNLREVGLLQATDSKKDNIQILGRLRKLRDFPDVVPRLTFMACETIPHSMRYAQNKREHFDGRILNFKTMRIPM